MVLKLLGDDWLILITILCNQVFYGQYPQVWTYAKFFVCFKKGIQMDPNNYRGISIMTALAKIYDGIIRDRFVLWYTPEMNQAGGQPGRGCEEQILTLRLLIDYAKHTKQVLYVLFVDYQKAYDRVNRNKLLQLLAEAGCGEWYLKAVGNALSVSKSVLGDEVIDSSSGVRQGGTSSCAFFTFYINSTVTEINKYGQDGYLGNMHTLLLMDDTVIFSTSRQAMQQKLELLIKAATDLNMLVHPTKSEYMCINSKDKEPFKIDNICIKRVESYVYLGTPISPKAINQHVKEHIQSKQAHVMKFYNFVSKNNDAPFQVKYKVWNAALSSAILYGCETWYTSDLKAAEQVLLQTLKSLMGVRTQTCTDILLVELGISSAKAYISYKQQEFMKRKMAQDSFNSSLLKMAVDMALNARSPMGRYLERLLLNENDVRESDLDLLKQSIQNSQSSRRTAYLTLNPSLTVHPVYSNPNIPEFARISFSRLRLISHSLKIETGRWSRIDLQDRLCNCGEIQSEQHVLLKCQLTEELRNTYAMSYNSMKQLMESEDLYELTMFTHKVLHYMYSLAG
jgi:hypothetical protein